MSKVQFVVFTGGHDEVIVTTPELEAEVMKSFFFKGSGRVLETDDEVEDAKPGELEFSRKESNDAEVLIMHKFMVE